MPIYEYRCPACGAQFEQLLLSRDAPAPGCPACGGQVQRLVSRLGLAGTTPPTGDALFESDRLTFTQRQGLKGRVPQAAQQAYRAMRTQRQANGEEVGHPAPQEPDPDDPSAPQGHYHDPDHVHLVDEDEPGDVVDGAHPHGHDHADGHDHGHGHDDGAADHGASGAP